MRNILVLFGLTVLFVVDPISGRSLKSSPVLNLLKRKCFATTGSSDAFDQIAQDLDAVKNLIISMDFSKLSFELVDPTISMVCRDREAYKDQLNGFVDHIKVCFKEEGQNRITASIDTLMIGVQFMCMAEDAFRMFLADGGVDCLIGHRQKATECVTKNFMPFLNVTTLFTSRSENLGKVCHAFEDIDACVHDELGQCEKETTAQMVSYVFKGIGIVCNMGKMLIN